MYKVIQHQGNIELVSPDMSSKAVIALNDEGGRLIYLSHNHKDIVADLEHKPYKYSQAGSILFPFANRINKGKYEFEGKEYVLDCNEPGRENAIHGFVFNKEFKMEESQQDEDFSSIKISYTEDNPPKGFPFNYRIEFTYTLNEKALTLKVEVKNIGNESFPFNLGWHPYFCVSDFETSSLSFDSHQQVEFDEDLITQGINETLIPNPYGLKGKALDDCFVLNNKRVEFHTEAYKVSIEGGEKSTYLQIYAPPGEHRLAVEPMTGISDSFNHKIGLYVLKPQESSSETWSIGFLS
jgi:aldose 1-epimerase